MTRRSLNGLCLLKVITRDQAEVIGRTHYLQNVKVQVNHWDLYLSSNTME